MRPTFLWLLFLLVVSSLSGCQPKRDRLPTADAAGDAPTVAAIPTSEPTVRVRIAQAAEGVKLTSRGGLWIGPMHEDLFRKHRRRVEAAANVTLHGDRYAVSVASGDAFTWLSPQMRIEGYLGEPVTVGETAYPQQIVLHAIGVKQPNRFDVINHVKMESYLPGVLSKELYPTWHPTAFRAQAIAARTYAMFEKHRNRAKAFDVESTTASQAYIGAAANPRAIVGARDTQGMFVTWQGKLVPTYYSSCCGGTGQDAVVAFGNNDMPPLRGSSRGDWCRESTYFRWGPIERDTKTLTARIAAWGRANDHVIRNLRELKAIHITQLSSGGRPAQFTLVEADGGLYRIGPETFRFACNYDDGEGGKLPMLKPEALLRSSHLRVGVHGPVTRFTGGKGFGHGVGLCQWGAQAMAVKGLHEYEIVSFYYPHADIVKLY